MSNTDITLHLLNGAAATITLIQAGYWAYVKYKRKRKNKNKKAP